LPDRFGRAKRGKVWKHWLAAHGAARQAQVPDLESLVKQLTREYLPGTS